jgi:hypothetical protein
LDWPDRGRQGWNEVVVLARVVAAIAEGRQKKADAVVKEYLQRRAEYQDRNKR